MSTSQTIIPSIYKIDLQKVAYFSKEKVANISAHKAHRYILAYHARQRKEGLSKARPYGLQIPIQELGKYQAAVYGTTSDDHKPHA